MKSDQLLRRGEAPLEEARQQLENTERKTRSRSAASSITFAVVRKYDFLVTTGRDILKPEVIEAVPTNWLFHNTHLVEKPLAQD